MDKKLIAKVISESDTHAVVGGYGVVFGGKDLYGETFTKQTEFMVENVEHSTPVFYDHTFGAVKHDIGRVTKAAVDDFGIWMESQIDKSKEYAAEILELVKQGKLGYSTGTAGHLVERLENIIKRWPIFELSLTATPAEPRTLGVEELKSMGVVKDANASQTTTTIEGAGHVSSINHERKGKKMKVFDIVKTLIMTLASNLDAETVDSMANGIVSSLADEQPETIKAAVNAAIEAIEPEPAPAEDPVTSAHIKAAIREVLEEINTPSQPSPGVTINAAPSIKKITGVGGDHDGGEGFKHWLSTGQENDYTKNNRPNWSSTKAALQEGTTTEGGVLVPVGMLSEIIAKRDEASVPHRAGARVIQTNLDSVQVPAENGTGAFAITAEEGAYNQSEPTFTDLVVTVYKFTNLTKVSEELLADDQANLESFLADMWGRSLAAMYNQYTITGTGSSQPKGVHVGGTNAVAFAGAAAITAAEVTELYHGLPEPYGDNESWLCRRATLGYLRGLQGTDFNFGQGIAGGGDPNRFYGNAPVYQSDQVAAMATTNITLSINNWAFYALVERAGLTVSRNPWLYQANGQVGFFVSARWGGDVAQAEAFQYADQA